jgi:hypothetical protein
MSSLKIIAGMLALIAAASPAFGQSVLRDPMIPDDERATYRVSIGAESHTVRYHAERSGETGESRYRITSRAPHEIVIVELTTDGLATRLVDTSGINQGLTFSTVSSVPAQGDAESDRIVAIGMPDLLLKLRGFPFESDEPVPVLFIVGNRRNEDEYAPYVVPADREEIEVAGRSVDAYKVELQFETPRLWRAFGLVPRTFFWYGAESPHVLLRAETTEVAGSPRWLMELTAYSGWQESR